VNRLETLVALALVVAIAIMAGVLSARAADACLAVKPRDQKGQYYQWRTVDNRTCWYAGRTKKAKSQLHWAVQNHPSTEPPGVDPVGAVGGFAVSPLSNGPDGTFLHHWRDIMNELAFPWWQDRTEVRTWTGVLSGGR
jgi:hypothetical protein